MEFDVDATKTVSQVGAGCIVLQEKNSSGTWTNVAYYYPVDYPDILPKKGVIAPKLSPFR